MMDDPSELEVELARVRAKLESETDPDIREGLALKIQRLEAQQQPEGIDADDAVRPNRASLEAQARELQVELLDLASRVERAGPDAIETDRAELSKIRSALAGVMQQLAVASGIADLPVGPLPEPPTPAAQLEADRLVREARVLKMRGQSTAAHEKLNEALGLAPGSVSTLLAVSEHLAELGKPSDAMPHLMIALRLEPDFPGLQRKFSEISASGVDAEEIMRLLRQSSVDDLLRSASSASVRGARWMSLFLPGLGQIVSGATRLGVGLLASWLAMLTWAFLMPNGMDGLLRSVSGVRAEMNAFVLVPMFLALCIHVAAVAMIQAEDTLEREVSKAAISRPRPPVDLPFE